MTRSLNRSCYYEMLGLKYRTNKKKNRKRILVLFCLLLVFPILFLRIWFLSKAVESAYETNLLMTKKESLEEENKKLLIEIAKLKSPERISKIAVTDLNMIRPSKVEVVVLGK